jgi:hypothetical protein
MISWTCLIHVFCPGFMKAHNWLLLFTVFGVWAFRDVLSPPVMHLWCRFCQVFSLLSARSVRISDLDSTQNL